jgi:hypothetical protein
MPSAYTIDQTRSIVLSRGWGIITDRELLAHTRALAADPRFAPHFCQLADLRDITHLQVTGVTIRQLARLSPFEAGARRALVGSTDAVYGMARMFQLMRDKSPDDIQVFRDLDAALEWLGMAGAKDALLAALSEAPPTPWLA